MSSIFITGFVKGTEMMIASHITNIISWEMCARGFKKVFIAGQIARVAIPIFLLLKFLLSKKANIYPFYAIFGLIGGVLLGISVNKILNHGRAYLGMEGVNAEANYNILKQLGR